MTDYPLCLHQEHQLAREELSRSRRLPVPPANYVDILDVRGPLDVARLSFALNRVVRRHSALRSSLQPSYGLPSAARTFQLGTMARTGICEPGMYSQRVHDLVQARVSTVHASENDRQTLQRLLFEAAVRPFDYRVPPLLRCTALAVGREQHYLILSLPQIVCDAPSLDVLWGELFQFYRGECLPAVESGQHHEFAEWQRARAQSDYFREARDYWEEQWNVAVADPGDQVHRARTPLRAASHEIEIGASLSSALRAFCQSVSAAPYVVFLTAFGIFLRQYAWWETPRVWIECGNRLRDETESIVGSIMNSHLLTLPVRGRASGIECLESCRRVTVDALRHQEIPLALLWRMLGCRPRLATPAASFTWRTAKPAGASDDLVIERVLQRNTVRRASFAAALLVLECEDNYRVVMSGALVSQSHAEPVADGYLGVLEGLLTRSDLVVDVARASRANAPPFSDRTAVHARRAQTGAHILPPFDHSVPRF